MTDLSSQWSWEWSHLLTGYLGAGVFARVVIQETPGVFLPVDQCDADHVASAWNDIAKTHGQVELQAGGEQTMKVLRKAAETMGISIT